MRRARGEDESNAERGKQTPEKADTVDERYPFPVLYNYNQRTTLCHIVALPPAVMVLNQYKKRGHRIVIFY